MSSLLTNRRRFLLWISAPTLGGVALLLWLIRDKQEIQRAPPNPFVKTLVFERIDDGQPIGDMMEMRTNAGVYASIVLTAAGDTPVVFEEHEVQDPARWPLALFIYPRGASAESEDSLGNPCMKFNRQGVRFRQAVGSGPKLFVPVRGTTRGYWTADVGFEGDLKPPKSWPEDEIRFWTFFALRDQRPGEYVYELTLYPTARWTSSVRITMGPPVVLRRGLLRVGANEG